MLRDQAEPTAIMPKDAAIRRVHAAGLTLAEAINATDKQLLAFPSIGRKTLRWVRGLAVLET